jgi:hypothetical protein
VTNGWLCDEIEFSSTEQLWSYYHVKLLRIEDDCVPTLERRVYNSSLGKPRKCNEIIADGNCFYRCLSLEICGHQEHHMALRKRIAEVGAKYKDRIEEFYSITLPPRDICEGGVWAKEEEIIVATIALQTRIAIYSEWRGVANSSWH